MLFDLVFIPPVDVLTDESEVLPQFEAPFILLVIADTSSHGSGYRYRVHCHEDEYEYISTVSVSMHL